MKRFLLFTLALSLMTLEFSSLPPARNAQAQQPQTRPTNASAPSLSGAGALSPAEINRIITAMAAKETIFRQALNQYSFRRDATLQTIGLGGQVSGEYRRISQFVFDDRGNRSERIIQFPMPTLTELTVTQEDLEDLAGTQLFSLDATHIDQYNLTYVGKERIDELNLYVFDVTPRMTEAEMRRSRQRFFQGRIWVDDQDLQIVKARGKAVPEVGDQRFPIFETYREQIDGRFWFPTYTYADDQLVFRNGNVVHIRLIVRFTDYQRFRSRVEVTDIDDNLPVPEASPSPSPTPPTRRP